MNLKWNHVIFPFLLLFALGCDSSKTDLEEEVLYSILPKVADSMVTDFRMKIPLPPPPPGLDSSDSLDYARRMAQSRKDYKKQKEELELDTTRLVIGVDLKVIPIEQVHISRFLEEKEVRPDSVSLKSNQEFQLGLEKIKEQEKFIFKSSTSFLTQDGKLNSTPEGLFMGVISISNIIFDDSRTKGVLTAGYACGNLCGYSFRIYIELHQGAWNISEMKMYSIS